jgi:hypothetical protein
VFGIGSSVHLKESYKCKCTVTVSEQTQKECCSIHFTAHPRTMKTKNTTVHMLATVSSVHLKANEKCKCVLALTSKQKNEKKCGNAAQRIFLIA